jgi:hypothetical protein
MDWGHFLAAIAAHFVFSIIRYGFLYIIKSMGNQQKKL